MIWHGPTYLDGPVTKDRPWWLAPVADGGVATVRDGEIRLDLVRRVRAEIAAGTYDTPDKLEIALGRLLYQLDQE
jgi:hypothetical protein